MKASTLIDVIGEAGYEAQDYVGRGMFGRGPCVGVVVTRDVSAFKLAAELCAAALNYFVGEEAHDFLVDLAELKVASDDFGCDSIIYFPGIPWEVKEEDDAHDCEGPSCCTPT